VGAKKKDKGGSRDHQRKREGVVKSIIAVFFGERKRLQ
jgi:hypothetical protein